MISFYKNDNYTTWVLRCHASKDFKEKNFSRSNNYVISNTSKYTR